MAVGAFHTHRTGKDKTAPPCGQYFSLTRSSAKTRLQDTVDTVDISTTFDAMGADGSNSVTFTQFSKW